MTLLSITTDYRTDRGSPEPYLRRIAQAGFSHVHWCHQWNTDFLYSHWEINQIKRWLDDLGLRLLDLHASHGMEKRWASIIEYERLSGIDLVKNRIEMTAELGGDVVIIHYGAEVEDPEARDTYIAAFHETLDELEPFARDHGVRIALENGRLRTIMGLVSKHSPDYLGLCYDSGHANMAGEMEDLVLLKDRLFAVHLHDNDGVSDQHKPLFSGTIDWRRLASIVAESSYTKCVSMELSIRNSGIDDEDVFLTNAFHEGAKFSAMVEQQRSLIAGA